MRHYSALCVAGLLAILAALSCSGAHDGHDQHLQELRSEEALENAPYRDSTQPIETRVTDLMGRMTLNEKIGQMLLVDWRYLVSDQDILNYQLGALLGGGGAYPQPNTPDAWADQLDGYQEIMQSSVLRIPLLFGNDAVHGFGNLHNATIFPHHIGLGAINDAEIVRNIAAATAVEITAVGVNWNYAPAVSVPQDIRWGRSYEGYSSQSEIVSALSVAEIEGLQTDNALLATAKHFVADGGTFDGEDRGDARIDEDVLRAVHLPPFEAAVESGVHSVMISYSSINGTKMHERADLIQGILKEELGFDGLIVSDWAAIYELPGTLDNQLQLAINAGIDMIMIPEHYQDLAFAFHRLVGAGIIRVSRIDESVRRILRVKFATGLFEDYLADREKIERIGSAEHRQLGREAVARSIVLLKNNDTLLPLDVQDAKKILIVGRHADDIGAQSGGWTIEWQGKNGDITAGTTILEAFRAQVPHVDYAASFFELEELAGTEYDYIVVAVGEDPYAEGVGDKSFPSLSAAARSLIAEAQEQFSAPVITLLITGRPLVTNEAEEASDAFLVLWLPGTEGEGVTDIIFGHRSVNGTLPFPWPDSRDYFEQPGSAIRYNVGYGLQYAP